MYRVITSSDITRQPPADLTPSPIHVQIRGDRIAHASRNNTRKRKLDTETAHPSL
jgi:hypothetical protein